MDKFDSNFPINLNLIRRFFTNDFSSLMPVVKTYDDYYEGDFEKIKIFLYLNKMMIYLLELLEEINKKPEKEILQKILKTKCENKYALFTQSFDFFTEIQSVLETYKMKKSTKKIEGSDIDTSDVMSLKIVLEDNHKDSKSKTHIVLNKTLVFIIFLFYLDSSWSQFFWKVGYLH